MAFDDLTHNQARMLIELLKALASGSYRDEFVIGRRPGQPRGFIHLYGNTGISDHEIEGFTDSDLETLKEDGYVALVSGGRAFLKQKAFQQYKLLGAPSAPSGVDIHLERLRKLYKAVGGSQCKAVVLPEVLADEGLTDEEARKVADYMEGEGWIKIIADNGPSLVELTHPGIKAAQDFKPLPLLVRPVKNQIVSKTAMNETLEEWAGARNNKATLALVFTDIVKSTDIGNLFGDNDWVPIVMKHFEQARRIVDKHNGYLIKVIGDACMVAFRTTVDAFHFANEFYIETGHELISIRAAINHGHVWIIDNDVYGLMVNLTSRIQHTVTGHGIALSDATAKDVINVLGKNKRGIRFGPRSIDLRSFGVQPVWQLRTLEMIAAEAPRTKAREKILGKHVTPPTQQKAESGSHTNKVTPDVPSSSQSNDKVPPAPWFDKLKREGGLDGLIVRRSKKDENK